MDGREEEKIAAEMSTFYLGSDTYLEPYLQIETWHCCSLHVQSIRACASLSVLMCKLHEARQSPMNMATMLEIFRLLPMYLLTL